MHGGRRQGRQRNGKNSVQLEGSDDPVNSWTQTSCRTPATCRLRHLVEGSFSRGATEVLWPSAMPAGRSGPGSRQRHKAAALRRRVTGGTRLAVGWLGAVTVSKNAGTWRLAKGVELVNLEDVIHDGDQFIAVGKTGKVGLSPDGEAWTFHESGTAAWLKHVTIGGGIYAAVGTRGTIVTSINGSKWTERNTPTTNGLESVAFGNGQFVAVGFKGTILYSGNGQRWISAKSGTDDG
ncbi:MAG: hypothetical protein CM1200mP29_12520 [Verrucomicrobiota bacterium]|nr:MAG: hypothetical protein CM1200mP29_12520 [Verrucomicrobiota bacterium]